MLKAECAFAIWRAMSPCGETIMTISMNHFMKRTKIMLPITLNMTWATATRRAVRLARKEASTAVIQVPILSPRSTGMAPSSGIRP